MLSFFRSHGSDVSHGSGCRAWFFQGYAWFSLCRCSSHLTTRMWSLEMSPNPNPTAGFFFCVNLDCSGPVWWHLRTLIMCELHEQSEHNRLFSYALKSNWYRTDTPQIRMERSTYAVDTSRVHFIRKKYVTCT